MDGGYARSVPRQLPPAETTAVITMEMQRGVVGDLASMPALAATAAARHPLADHGTLVPHARKHAVPVVHAVVSWRADRRGTSINTPLTAMLAKIPEQILEGTPAVELVPELGDTTHDLHSHRNHALTPFTGTDLDAMLRSIGITTVVACGVSLNVGVLGLCLSASDLGYRVVVCSDAVVGVPVSYGDEVMSNTIAMIAEITTTQALVAHWALEPARA
ncbi:cysteine hydrolase [soil metagenome]